jgi:hypothetical protein
VQDNLMVAGKFLHLMDFPDLAVASGLTEKDHRSAAAMDLIIKLCIFQLQK